MKTFIPVLALFAAFACGAVLADAAPNSVRARNFVLMDDKGNTVAVFETQPGKYGPIVMLDDAQGRALWSAGGDPIQPLSTAR
jgi:hypothetical protein